MRDLFFLFIAVVACILAIAASIQAHVEAEQLERWEAEIQAEQDSLEAVRGYSTHIYEQAFRGVKPQ